MVVPFDVNSRSRLCAHPVPSAISLLNERCREFLLFRPSIISRSTSTGRHVKYEMAREVFKQNVLSTVESEIRRSASRHLGMLESILYIGIAVLLSVTAIAAAVRAAMILWQSLAGPTAAGDGLLVLDQVLLVLMLVEILHTIRISVRSSELMLIGPFLVVALIASVRRVLVITLQAAKLAQGGPGTAESAVAFRNAMVELGLLGFLILVFAVSIYLLRRPSNAEERSQA
jgi:uncharacterized membrane protein (DUF373 family)